MARTPTICSDKLARMFALTGSVIGALRPDTAVVLRRSRASDGAGGFLESWSEVEQPGLAIEGTTTNVTARVKGQGMQPWEKMDRIEGRVVATSVWLIALPPGTDVQPPDRINVTSLGRVYDVIASDGPQSFEVERSVQCVIVE